MDSVVTIATKESRVTCEITGQIGSLCKIGYSLRTLSEDGIAEVLKDHPEWEVVRDVAFRDGFGNVRQ